MSPETKSHRHDRPANTRDSRRCASGNGYRYGGRGGPIFNAYGQVIGIVRAGFVEGGGLNFGISTNAIFEALNLTNQDHPKGFVTGITNGLELRSKEEIAKDGAADLTGATVGDLIRITQQTIQKAQSADNLWLPKSSVPTATSP